MKKKRVKKAYQKIRIPLPRQTGGFHVADKGGKYRRTAEKDKIRQEVKAELE
ncbi:MAG: hypothetical protein UW79_C0024G0008 [Candidatus Yanofskybacteria bacterium GW2011_GWA2_44_9]|uniref:Uncharacterized protein n=1 Tax=Candidatus Yanofskybacteria bacterium GW2011_GWA2_44_9 TaxID=1619025 RepID=A0A0G1KCB1_9BACT|nr:MAG: hypothetical protein UW79_C0024G0008 [Candidatus Yanofskybacteria bacterium GW2011_GWA2_44_9]